MRHERRGLPITPRVIVGLMIVGFGLALTLDNLNIIESDELIRYWPFGLIAIGLVKLFQDQDRSGRIGGGIMAAIGAIFAAEHFLYVDLDVWRWWPLALVFLGGMILVRALRASSGSEPARGSGRLGGPTIGGGVTSSPGGATTEQTLSEFAMWSGIQRRVASPAFRRAELTAVMGGIELDLRQAGTETGEAVVDVFVLWGGIEITVPPDWAVSNEVTPIMGGAEDKSTGTQQSRHRLIVRGVVIMGGVDIKI